MPTVSFHTLGCKLNFAETAALGKQFLDRGFEIVGSGDGADVVVINTCSVTERADRECRQLIRRAARGSRDPYVVVTGCYAQLEPEKVASIAGVDLVLGAKEKFELFSVTREFTKADTPRVFVSAIDSVDAFGPAFSTSAADRTRAYLKVQDGCDFNCSFCTIPLARGASRSQSIGDSLAQARALVEQGYKEIVLTGVNVGDYGKKDGASLATLLRQLVTVQGLERVRISSIEPNLLTPEIIDLVAESPVLCHHFHIPLQSGCDAVLKGMRRRYTTADYRNLVHRIVRTIPACGIGVDVIAGFPGETETHFEETVRFLTDLPVSYLHVFTYSERPHTPASSFGSAVQPRDRFRRSERLRALGQKKRHAFAASLTGSRHKVLLEGVRENSLIFGYTENYVRVGIPENGMEENMIVDAEIGGIADGYATAIPQLVAL